MISRRGMLRLGYEGMDIQGYINASPMLSVIKEEGEEEERRGK